MVSLAARTRRSTVGSRLRLTSTGNVAPLQLSSATRRFGMSMTIPSAPIMSISINMFALSDSTICTSRDTLARAGLPSLVLAGIQKVSTVYSVESWYPFIPPIRTGSESSQNFVSGNCFRTHPLSAMESPHPVSKQTVRSGALVAARIANVM